MRKKNKTDTFYRPLTRHLGLIAVKETPEIRYACVIKNATAYYAELAQHKGADFSDLPRLLKQTLNSEPDINRSSAISNLIFYKQQKDFADMVKYLFQNKEKFIEGYYIKTEDEYNQICHRLLDILKDMEESEK